MDYFSISLISSSTAVFAAGVCASLIAAHGTLQWKKAFLLLVCLAIVIVEYYFVGLASLKIPSGLFVVQSSCRASSKGGKEAGSLRDCTTGQAQWCSPREPCTPCDYPLGTTIINGIIYQNDCQICNEETNPGLCSSLIENQGFPQTCQNQGSDAIESCIRCCLDTGGHTFDYFYENSCQVVFNESFMGDWVNNPDIRCIDPEFPIKTTFGCCPDSSLPTNSAFITVESNLQVPPCALTGPNGGGWYYCQNETIQIQSSSAAKATVPAGCRIFSNGRFTGMRYCRPPSFVS